MDKFWLYVGLIIGLLAAGFAGGWAVKSGSVARAEATQSKAQVKQDAKDMDTRTAEERSAANETSQALLNEQQKTVALNGQLADARAVAASLQDTINHAHFQSKPTPAVLGVCPGSPYVDPAYMQLYERAATGNLAPSREAADSIAGRVPESQFFGLP